MNITAATPRIPALIKQRRWWFIPLLIWLLAVSMSLTQHLDDMHRHGVAVASEGARNLFRMVVLSRAWNAGHGGVYVPVSDLVQPNPYLEHPRRDLLTQDGTQLTMLNPAFMTRQLSELAQKQGGIRFHITSLNPIRPKNAPDSWERQALAAFETGTREFIELQTEAGSRQLRYMAPLLVTPPCLVCHAKQGYQVGDIRGGISVSLPFDPIAAASLPAREQTWMKHVAVFLLVGAFGWMGLEVLRRRWCELANNLVELEVARTETQRANDELAAARDAAEAASRAKSAVLATISHEFRTPLNGILGFAHLLQHADLPDKAQEQAQHIAHQGGMLLSLIDEVLAYTRIESLAPPQTDSTLDLPATLAELAEIFRHVAASKNLPVRIDLDQDLPARVAGEHDWLLGCLRPLIDNAVKFTQQGEVTLAVRVQREIQDECRVRFTITDSGSGIPETVRHKLFKPFSQTENVTTRNHGGLGLGLAISARYAEWLSGELTCTSAPEGGSQFRFDWPTRIVSGSPQLPQASLAQQSCSDLQAGLAELEQLLQADDMQSGAIWSSLLPLLAVDHDRQQLMQLTQQIEHYDYEAALTGLKALKARA